ALVVTASVLALLLRAPMLGRAAVLAAPVALAASLLASLAGLWQPRGLTIALAVATSLGPLALAALLRDRRAVGVALATVLLLHRVVPAWRPESNALAALGARPEGGGRFYGIGNRGETVLLATAIPAAAWLGLRSLVPIAALALATFGLSRTGADGGGIV